MRPNNRTTAATRTWSAPTSPRSPYKLPLLLRQLIPFQGRRLRDFEDEFATVLAGAPEFEGQTHAAEPGLSARERITRAPKTFGFIRLERGGPLEILPAGHALATEENTQDVLLRQLLKWQYPSPVHDRGDYRLNFRIKPFLEVLRLIRELEGLSKPELAIFGVTLVRYEDFDFVSEGIQELRARIERAPDRRSKQQIRAEIFRRSLESAYADDIAAGRIGLREQKGQPTTLDGFLKTKQDNCKDYADATFRYFRATGLFAVSGGNYRLRILPERREECNDILNAIEREPSDYADRTAYYGDFGALGLPRLPSENVDVARRRIRILAAEIPDSDKEVLQPLLDRVEQETDTVVLTRAFQQVNAAATQSSEQLQRSRLLQEGNLAGVLEDFGAIVDSSRPDRVPDPALYFEWNIGRAMLGVDNGEVVRNVRMDREGQPISFVGGVPDVVCIYRCLHLVVEATMSQGATQYRSEGESVDRHVGEYQLKQRRTGDSRPVFGLFVAKNLAASVVRYFYMTSLMHSDLYGGPVTVIPMDLTDFKDFITASGGPACAPEDLLTFFMLCREAAAGQQGELAWRNTIQSNIQEWGRRGNAT